MSYKTVLLPITVPLGNYCFGQTELEEWETCEHFDNEGGHPTCDLKISYFLKYKNDGNGVPKPKECLILDDKIINLKEVLDKLPESTKALLQPKKLKKKELKVERQTKDQIAKVMLLHGTPAQQEEVMEYIGILKREKEVHCSVCGKPIPVSENLYIEIIAADIWICDDCFYEGCPNYS